MAESLKIDYRRIQEYEKRRDKLNNQTQKYYLDDKFGFHVFADHFNIDSPNLLGVLMRGKNRFRDCTLQP